MRSAFLVAVLVLSLGSISAHAQGGWTTGLSSMGGAMPNAQMGWACVQAMQNYMIGGGPPPPAACDAGPQPAPAYSAPQSLTCQTFGNITRCW